MWRETRSTRSMRKPETRKLQRCRYHKQRADARPAPFSYVALLLLLLGTPPNRISMRKMFVECVGELHADGLAFAALIGFRMTDKYLGHLHYPPGVILESEAPTGGIFWREGARRQKLVSIEKRQARRPALTSEMPLQRS